MLRLNTKNIIKARKMLFQITSFLDNHNIKYFLEGGTLLGIVRDGDLLPWDHDVDISISSNDAIKFNSIKWRLFLCGYRITSRKGYLFYGPIKPNDYRIFKMKPIGFSLFKIFYPPIANRMVIVDIFVKKDDHLHTYWQSMGKILRVDKYHYQSQDKIMFKGKLLTVPSNYKDYLTAKYGDWSIKVKKWLCKEDEKTIVKI